jgi:hypothetical protein
MSLASLRPMLYAGRCSVELRSPERSFAARPATLALTGYYRTGWLDVSVRPAGMGSPPTGARIGLEGLESFLSSGNDGAITERTSEDGLHVVMFKAHHSAGQLIVTIRRARMPDVRESVIVGLRGLPEFFRWCSRASLIFYEGGRMCGFDAAELAELCGVAHDEVSARLSLDSYEGGAFVDVSAFDVFAEADPALDAEIEVIHRRIAGVQ